MDLESLIIGFAFMALCIVPIVYIQRKHKKEKAMLLKGFLNLGESLQLNMTEHEFWAPNYAIGIDPKQSKLLYSNSKEVNANEIFVDLLLVESCRVDKLSKEMNGNKIFDKIELILTYNRSFKRADSVLTFYDKDVSLNLNEELMLAEKWKALVDANLKARPTNTTQPEFKDNVLLQA